MKPLLHNRKKILIMNESLWLSDTAKQLGYNITKEMIDDAKKNKGFIGTFGFVDCYITPFFKL
jgi:hypothetical protein